MPTLAYTIGAIIASFVITLFVARFLQAGAGHDVAPPPSPAEQLAKLEAEQPAKEGQWIADLEREIAAQRVNLATLRAGPFTVESIAACGQAVESIENAERVLNLLYVRRCLSFDGTAATHYEGRM